MYKLEILPIAIDDMENIIYYISNNLKNTVAAKNLRDSFIDGFDHILEFPYGISEYKKTKKLKYKY